MNKYFLIFLLIAGFACDFEQNTTELTPQWEYTPHNHDVHLDSLCSPLIQSYEAVLKGLASNDTLILHQSAQAFLILTDTLNAGLIISDSLIKSSLLGLHGELEALVLETSLPEIKKAVHMVSLQMIQLLGLIGYQQKPIYIFNTSSAEQEDGLIWMGLNKKSLSPYDPLKHETFSAIQQLQEP